jgi:4-hydroxybenzoate polyprenyltransferase
VHFLRGQKEAGRKIILVTAADEKTARAVASHVGFFDDVLASDGERNLKGEEKAKELTRRFGRGGFDYAGDSRADLAVWREANGIILVNASPAVARQARALGNVTAEFGRSRPVLREVVRAMRPHQWVKNLLVFVPLLASRSFTDMPGLIGALLMFAAFCATASGIYLINDLSDLDADRRHPRKRNRPFASGALSLPIGVFLALFLLLIGYVLAESAGAVIQLGWYAAISLAYSLALKRYPLVDVFVLAALYTIRIVAGGVASGHLTTLWLLAFSGFTFLSLAFVKRAAEIISLSKDPRGSNQSIAGRGYYSGDYQTLQMFGVASAFASSVVLALFVSSTASFEQYSSPEMLWGVVPLVLFWQLRLWLSTQRGHMHDDPIVYASKDWVSWLVGASVGLIALMASAGIKLW